MRRSEGSHCQEGKPCASHCSKSRLYRIPEDRHGFLTAASFVALKNLRVRLAPAPVAVSGVVGKAQLVRLEGLRAAGFEAVPERAIVGQHRGRAEIRREGRRAHQHEAHRLQKVLAVRIVKPVLAQKEINRVVGGETLITGDLNFKKTRIDRID